LFETKGGGGIGADCAECCRWGVREKTSGGEERWARAGPARVASPFWDKKQTKYKTPLRRSGFLKGDRMEGGGGGENNPLRDRRGD